MNENGIRQKLQQIQGEFHGELHLDRVMRMAYATDASVYQQQPLAVAIPKNERDLEILVRFAATNQVGLIPRAAGTSLAGQVVGDGIVVDLGRHFTQVLEVNVDQQWVRVQPGVIRDELNQALSKDGLMFGPETSTSNRAMIGGMLGNNSCGSNSLMFGNTRDATVEIRGILSDGSWVTFGALSCDELEQKKSLQSREGDIYRGLVQLLAPEPVQKKIVASSPKPTIRRRNTGYALDQLIDSEVFGPSGQPLNLCKLIAGSEGTLVFATEVKLKLTPVPPASRGLLVVNCSSVHEALVVNSAVMKHSVYASELMDRLVLEGARRNRNQSDRMALIHGDPQALLVVELRGQSDDEVSRQFMEIQASIRARNLGQRFELLTGEKIDALWQIRKAGLGVLANVVGDEKPVTVIEDTAVDVDDLPDYIAEVDQLLNAKYGLSCAYYAHAGSGEIHMRPVLNLKTKQGVEEFRSIAADVAEIVKRYQGSLSGEHGDGRLRGQWIESMVGAEVYQLFRDVKSLFDPAHLFNPGKIIDTPGMTEQLRYQIDDRNREPETIFDFSKSGGIIRAAEMCSGSGDCRKTHHAGGTMCPSYMATRNEAESTRARANLLRQFLSEGEYDSHPLAREELKSVLDLCLSCKACKRECPSNVDMAKLKSETMQAYYDVHGTPGWAKRVASIERWSRMASRMPWLANRILGNHWLGRLTKRWGGVALQRTLPQLAAVDLHKWFEKHKPHANAGKRGSVRFFFDEFTSYTEPEVGQAAIELLERLGWSVEKASIRDSGRAAISVGLLRQAQKTAANNIDRLSGEIDPKTPLVSVEPSALLTLRDDYPDLLRGAYQQKALEVGNWSWTFEEFIDRLVQENRLTADSFDDQIRAVRLHGHCHEKAIIGLAPAVRTIQLPRNTQVKLIPSGCCGMAGAFGYQRERYGLSMEIGELVLFPTIRSEAESSLIVSAGTSCRHQILEGTGRKALHPAQVLRDACIV